MTGAGTWTLIVVDPGCGCCSYVPVRSHRDEATARRDLRGAGTGYELDFEPDDEDES